MKAVIRAALELLAWMSSIPLAIAFSTWLLRSKRIEIPDSVYPIHLGLMLLWALWIFQRNFLFWPMTLRRGVCLCVYLGAVAVAACAGVALGYVAVVMFLGGE